MTLASRPASPGTSVPSRNRSAPLEFSNVLLSQSTGPTASASSSFPPAGPGPGLCGGSVSAGDRDPPRSGSLAEEADPVVPAAPHAASRRRGRGAASASSWCSYGYGMFGKSLPRRTLPGQAELAQPGQQRRRVRRAHLVEEVGEHHRGVERHPLVALGQRQELRVLRGPGVGDHQPQPRVPRQQLRHRRRPGELGRRPGRCRRAPPPACRRRRARPTPRRAAGRGRRTRRPGRAASRPALPRRPASATYAAAAGSG